MKIIFKQITIEEKIVQVGGLPYKQHLVTLMIKSEPL